MKPQSLPMVQVKLSKLITTPVIVAVVMFLGMFLAGARQ